MSDDHACPYQPEVAIADARRRDVLGRAFDRHRERVAQIRVAHALRVEAAEASWEAIRSSPLHSDYGAALDALKKSKPDLKQSGDQLAADIRQIEAEYRDQLRRLGAAVHRPGRSL